MHHHRQSIQTEAGSLAFVEAGAGHDVILIHGALVTADDMIFSLFQELSARFHVVAFDRPGHGGSDQSPTERGSPWIQATLLQKAARQLGLTSPVVVGHSFGGAVALCSALAFANEIAGVVAVAPICFPELRLEQVIFGPRALPLFGPALAETAGTAMDIMSLPMLRRAMFLPQEMPVGYQEAFPFARASLPRHMISEAQDSVGIWPALTRSAWSYRACRKPVIILAGTHDIVVNNALHGRAAASLIPNAGFYWLPGLGHMLHHFRQKRIAQEIDRILDQQCGR